MSGDLEHLQAELDRLVTTILSRLHVIKEVDREAMSRLNSVVEELGAALRTPQGSQKTWPERCISSSRNCFQRPATRPIQSPSLRPRGSTTAGFYGCSASHGIRLRRSVLAQSPPGSLSPQLSMR